ncbi:DUF4124 domain-containing protein [Marinagarivorans algicola]|uniref:DUF4124 domain-containing protein n=1 Tax=Marinagarivorans algicola TaxID=1513270 RepID=UPI0006B603CA|nr:DUF4124 domain-containing protein [Marinagarivorans algicola]
MHPIKTTAIIVLFVTVLSLSLTALAGKYYKWVDENGVAHFSERPPQAAEATSVQTVKVKTHAKEDPSENSDEDSPPTQLSGPLQAATDPNAKQLDPERCKAEQERLKTLNSGSRIRMQDTQGGFYYLEKAQILKEIQRSQQAIRESCE